MALREYVDPWKGLSFLFTDTGTVDWKGTPGVGDILFGLNAVHMLTHLARKSGLDVPFTTMNVHWTHSEDHLHHFEDPETIIERTNYIHSFYHDKESVKINHIFNSTDEEIIRLRHKGFQRKSGARDVLDGIPHWMFRRDIWKDSTDSKTVVFWRPKFNAEIPRGWKRTFFPHDWDQILSILEDRGYTLVELTYRTPVREAFRAIQDARFCIFYDGMWQYIAKNLCKPVVALGDNGIINIHNPQGVGFKKPEPDKGGGTVFSYLKNLPKNLDHLDKRAKKYRDFILKELQVEDV
jgi:hypothetical protein